MAVPAIMDPQQEMFLAMVAGETSGDLLAGLVLQGLAADFPGLRSAGIGGPRMAQAGFEAWWPSARLAVHGYSAELVRRIWGILRIRKQLVQRLTAQPPRLFVGVDAPDFNLDLEAALRSRGMKTVHFVCPSIWAWRADRVEKIRRAADHVLCIFPFEPELLARHGIDATYVGHPLASVIPLQPDRAAARRRLGLPEDGLVLAVLSYVLMIRLDTTLKKSFPSWLIFLAASLQFGQQILKVLSEKQAVKLNTQLPFWILFSQGIARAMCVLMIY